MWASGYQDGPNHSHFSGFPLEEFINDINVTCMLFFSIFKLYSRRSHKVRADLASAHSLPWQLMYPM